MLYGIEYRKIPYSYKYDKNNKGVSKQLFNNMVKT